MNPSEIGAITGISISKYRASKDAGMLFPHNTPGVPLSDYQRNILESHNYFWYATAVPEHLTRLHPHLALSVQKNFQGFDLALQMADFNNALLTSLEYGARNSIRDSFFAETGVRLSEDEIASLAWQRMGNSGRKLLNSYLKVANGKHLNPLLNPDIDISDVVRQLSGVKGETVVAGVTTSLAKPQAAALGWTKSTFDFIGSGYVTGIESEDETIFMADSLIPIGFLKIVEILE